MKRLLILGLCLMAVASARTFRTTKSGLWNDSTVWAAAVPYPNADNDTVTIAATHSCTLNVDLSGLSNGLGKLADSGTLFMASNSGLMMKNDIIGNGRFRVGDSVTAVESVNIYVNGNYGNSVADAQYWGKDRTGRVSCLLALAAPVGCDSVKMDSAMDVRVGDVLAIGAAVQGQTGDASNPAGRGMYTVTSYSAVTQVAKITPVIATNNRAAGDVVSVVTRAIKIQQKVKSTGNVPWASGKNSQKFKNCWFDSWGGNSAVYNATGDSFVSCAGSNNTNGGVANLCANGTFSGTFTCTNNTLGGVAYACVSAMFSGTFTCTNNSNGGVANRCADGTFSGTFTCTNNSNGGVANTCANGTFSGTFTCTNNSNGGVANACAYGTFSGTFTSSETYQINYGTGYVSGSFPTNRVMSNYRSTLYRYRPWQQTIWLHYDSAYHHTVFAYAGKITTAADKGSIVFALEDSTNGPLILDFPLIAKGTVFAFAQKVQKSTARDSLPYIAFLDPTNDPLKKVGGATIAADTMTNSTATDEWLRINATGLTAGKQYVLRLRAWGSSGTVTWYERNIAEAGYQMTHGGASNWFKFFP